MAPRSASIHIDIDSPETLLRFWGFHGIGVDLDGFYDLAMSRALSLLRQCGIQATFFCVGSELERSSAAAAMIRQASREGHEIANHTYSHPFALSTLSADDIRTEVAACSAVIRRVTGTSPVGFRAPGYQVTARVLQVLEELGIEYDSSAFWSVLHPAMRVYRRIVSERTAAGEFGAASIGLPRDIYYPGREDWTRKGEPRALVEVPLPRTRMLSLPFYSNFHLATGSLYRALSVALMNQPYFVYLVHLVEFTDLSDGLPPQLRAHPNVRTETAVKLNALRDTILSIMKRYRIVTSAQAVGDFKTGGCGSVRHVVGAVNANG